MSFPGKVFQGGSKYSIDSYELLIMRFFGLFPRCLFGKATDDCPFVDIRVMGSVELQFKVGELALQLFMDEGSVGQCFVWVRVW